MGSIIIHLKQHTPMWHFQADESGCTLRVTEVKPKLDKFIIEELGGKGFVPDSYWTDSSKKNDSSYFALDYKLKFQAIGDNSLNNVIKCSTFFGNMGDSEPKKLVYYPEGIFMTIFSLNKDLKNTIIEYINQFFAFHNFGTRQSKGFGSFYIDENDLYYKSMSEISKNKNIHLLSFFAVHEPMINYRRVFEYIDIFYKSIRSGINDCKKLCFKKTDCRYQEYINKINICSNRDRQRCEYMQSGSIFYCKSLLFKYLDSKRIQWDKKTIKEVLYKQIEADDVMRKKYYLYRDLLGLASDVKYGCNTLNKKDINNKEEAVQRFKSPIFIKPILGCDGYIVYVGYIDLRTEQNILKKKFQITISQGKTVNASFEIQTPERFDLGDYFDYLLRTETTGISKFEINEVTSNKVIRFKNTRLSDAKNELSPKFEANYPIYKKLEHIYKELRKNYKSLQP